FLAANVVGLFEATIEKMVALAVLMPIVASMGGIAGSQTLVLIIRGIALGHVEQTNAKWLLAREVAVGLLNGLVVASVVGLAAGLWFKQALLGLVVFAALMINLLAAALAGVGVPLMLKRLGIDPAIAGGVVVTTVTDVIGFASLLGLGSLFLLLRDPAQNAGRTRRLDSTTADERDDIVGALHRVLIAERDELARVSVLKQDIAHQLPPARIERAHRSKQHAQR